MSSSDQVIDDASRILDTMLGFLGFFAELRVEETPEGPGFQVATDDARLLIGRHGDRLDDLQFLLNRLLQVRHPDAPKFRVDVGHYRSQRETEMVEKVRGLAKRVASTGKAVRLNPLNSYHRRIVHNALKDIEGIETWSSDEPARLKRIVIRPQGSSAT